MAQTVKNPPAVQETRFNPWVRKILEKGMATHSSILAWRSPRTEEPGRLQSMGLQRVRHDWSDLACTGDHWQRRHKAFKTQQLNSKENEELLGKITGQIFLRKGSPWCTYSVGQSQDLQWCDALKNFARTIMRAPLPSLSLAYSLFQEFEQKCSFA